MRILLSILFFFIPACVLNSQPVKSIHVEEYDKYRYQDKAVSKSMSKYKIDLRNALNNNSRDKKFVGFHAYWAGEKYLNYRYDLISDLIYFGFEIDSEDGSISNTRDYLEHPIYDLCKSSNTKLHLAIILFGNNKISTFLNNSNSIDTFIAELSYYNSQKPFDGINIDFEALPDESRDKFIEFIKKLDKAFPEKEISIDIPAVDWYSAYDFDELNDIIDFYFMMGYDYYWSGSDNAGPVSPLSSSGISIKYSLNRYETNRIDKDKLILGLPWYGRRWQVVDSSYQSVVLGNSEALSYDFIKNKHPASNFDTEYSSNYLTYNEDGDWYELWYDDSLAFSNKVKYAFDEDIMGVGVWALHYQSEHEELWEAYENLLQDVSVEEEQEEQYETVEYYDLEGRRVEHKEDQIGKLLIRIRKDSKGKISTDGIYFDMK